VRYHILNISAVRYHTRNVCVGPKKIVLRSVYAAMLWSCGHSEDRWANVAPAAKVMLALSQSTALGATLPSVVGLVRAGCHYVCSLGVGWN
jgi:hypothetical protein